MGDTESKAAAPAPDVKRTLIIGASSGIGAALARRLASEGHRLALVARRKEDLEKLAAEIKETSGEDLARVYPHDVTKYEDVPVLFDLITEDLGGLEYVIYAAGVMPSVAINEFNFDKDRQMIEVNVLGMIAWLNQAADLFSRLQKGVICGIGSLAGDRGRKGQPGYNTSKGAQAIFLESLRNRLASKNVRVITIKPGFVDTAMTTGMGNLLWMISAEEAARKIARTLEDARGTVYVPWRWNLVSFVIRHMPSFIFRRLDI